MLIKRSLNLLAMSRSSVMTVPSLLKYDGYLEFVVLFIISLMVSQYYLIFDLCSFNFLLK